MTPLSPCPYCRTDNLLHIAGDYMSGFSVHCRECEMSGPNCATENLAVMAWECLPRRADPVITETST